MPWLAQWSPFQGHVSPGRERRAGTPRVCRRPRHRRRRRRRRSLSLVAVAVAGRRRCRCRSSRSPVAFEGRRCRRWPGCAGKGCWD